MKRGIIQINGRGIVFPVRMMRFEIFHASKYGNGAKVAEELKRSLVEKGFTGEVHHMKEARASDLPQADLYVFGSPGRIGKPIGTARRFLKKLNLPAGTRYAIFTTEGAPRPDKKTGKMPTEEELARWQRIAPIMDELLQAKGLVKVGGLKVYVMDIKGPLEEGWETRVQGFASSLAEAMAAPK